MQVMARARSSSFVRLPVFLIVTLVFCEAWPSQALHGHGHGRIHRKIPGTGSTTPLLLAKRVFQVIVVMLA